VLPSSSSPRTPLRHNAATTSKMSRTSNVSMVACNTTRRPTRRHLRERGRSTVTAFLAEDIQPRERH
jgi:hypothetical protein